MFKSVTSLILIILTLVGVFPYHYARAAAATQIIVSANPSSNMFIACGNGTNTLAYSYDGINWTGLGNIIFPGANGGVDVNWNGSMWIAGGSGATHLAYSYDGINWAGISSSLFVEVRQTAWNGSRWVAAGSGAADLFAYSDDGLNWTGLGKTFMTTNGYGVSWGNGMYIANGTGTNSFAYSNDGLNWTGLGNPFTVGYRGSWNGSMWVNGAYDGGTNALAYSYDGLNWTGLGMSVFGTGTTSYVRGTGWNGSMWLAMATSATNSLAYSYDGLNWTGLGSSMFSVVSYRSIWTGRRWVAVGNGTANTMAYSDDGLHWTGLGKTLFSGQGRGIATNRVAPRGDIKSGAAFFKQPVITAKDGSGNVDTTYTGTVTISKASGAGTLSGTLTESFVSGVADFSGNGLTYTATADQEPFTLAATDGTFSVTTSSLIADAVATQLVFSTQPGDASTGDSLATQPVVTAKDANGLVDTDFNELITISVATGTGTLSNNTKRAVNGVATFTNLIYNPGANNETFSLSANDEDTWSNDANLNLPAVTSASAIGNDTTAPVITLTGSSSIILTQGETYTDAGATATDTNDGDLTSSITVVNPVNTNLIGTYTITYNVTDAASNAATQVTRTVKVVSGPSLPTSFTQTPEQILSAAGQGTLSSALKMNDNIPFTTTNRKVSLTFDNLNNPLITRLAISPDTDFTNDSLINYTPTYEYDLCGTAVSCPDGKYSVYARYYTVYGQHSQTIPLTITLSQGTAVPVSSQAPLVTPSTASVSQPSSFKPVSINSPVFTASLKKGMQSEIVRTLQTLLATDKKTYPEGLITGYFGALTEKAIQRFQLRYNIVSSASDPGFGLLGPKTKSMMKTVFGK